MRFNMDRKELQIIQELMDKLSEQMELSEDDLGSRLGRQKPSLEAVKIEVEPEMEEEESEEMPMEEPEMSSPDESLKSRLMKLRSGE